MRERRVLAPRWLVGAVAIAAGLLVAPGPGSASGTAPRVTAGSSLPDLAGYVQQSPAVAYALFGQLGAACGTFVARTDDGGHTFEPPVRVQRLSCASSYGGESIGIAAAGDVLVYGHGLFVSRDGGAVWSKVALGGSALQVVAHAGTTWLVEATCAVSVQHACAMRVAISTDGLRTWHFTPTAPVGATSTSGIVDRTYLLVANDGTAYVFSQTPRVAGNTGPQRMWTTSNGGATWQTRSVPCRNFSGTDAALAPSGAIWSACAGEPGAGQQGKQIDVSYDHGSRWRLTGECGPTAARSRHDDGILCEGYAQDLVAQSGEVAYLANDRGALLVTDDGGWRWSAFSAVTDGAGYLLSVGFLDAEHGFVLGGVPGELLWTTANGGRTWRLLTPRWR